MGYKTIAVPFRTKDNRQYLADEQLEEIPELKDFVGRFPKCFERDDNCCVWWFYPEGDSPNA